LIISTTGKEGVVEGKMIKKGCVLIDVGSAKGDVDGLSVINVADFVSPVPGGVGPMTITMLLQNTVLSAKKLNQNK